MPSSISGPKHSFKTKALKLTPGSWASCAFSNKLSCETVVHNLQPVIVYMSVLSTDLRFVGTSGTGGPVKFFLTV